MTKEPSDSDKKLWQHVAASIRPLSGRKKPVAKTAPTGAKTNIVKNKKQPLARDSATPAPRAPVAAAIRETAPSRKNPGFDKATESKLKKGKLEIEGRIDLHGMTQDEAYRALSRFLQSAVRQGKRNLLVITGKGSVSTGGVLRRNLPLWLEDDARILALTPAAQKDGGSGAFYIRLRKSKTDK